MKSIVKMIAATSLCATLLAVPTYADERELIEMPADVQVKFLTEMRGLLESVDEMLLALAEGDFDKISKIADIELGFKHRKWQKMIADGASEDEVQAKINKMRDKLAMPHDKKKMKNSKSMSRFMPDNARAMGRQMHLAASSLSLVAQGAGDKPDIGKYQEIAGGIQQITTMCASCHNGYKIR